MHIDGTLIRTLRERRAHGLQTVATECGISQHVLKRIEQGDPAAADMLTVQALIALAATLSVNPSDLLTRHDTQETHEPTAPAPATKTSAALGGLLLEHGGQLPYSAICDALDITTSELNGAITDLATRLQDTGLTLRTRNYTVKLVATDTKTVDTARTRIATANYARSGLDITTAKTLHRAWAGKLTTGRRGQTTLIALGYLAKVGALQQSGTETYQPSDALKYALDV